MKKLLLVLAVLMSLGIWEVSAGNIWNTPSAGESNPIPADYGGVDVATNSFIVGLATVPSEVGPQGIGYRKFYASTTTVNNVYAATRWTVYGVNWSTGLCSNLDFVSIQVSSGPASAARELTRDYNYVFISTMANGNVCGGTHIFRWPIRAYGNLFWGVNYPGATGAAANPYNRLDLFYIRETE